MVDPANTFAYWKNGFEAFILSGHELHVRNSEWADPKDQVQMQILPEHPEISLISAVDGRGTTDDSPNYNKFLAYSNVGSNQIVTTYLVYLYNGPVKVRAWDEKKRSLLENVNMYHIDITPSRVSDLVIQKHLSRISGKSLIVDGLAGMAEACFFDMYWNVPSF